MKENCNLLNVRLVMCFGSCDLCVGLLVGINPISLALLDGKTAIFHQLVGRYCFNISIRLSVAKSMLVAITLSRRHFQRQQLSVAIGL